MRSTCCSSRTQVRLPGLTLQLTQLTVTPVPGHPIDVFCQPSQSLHTCSAQIYVQARHHTSKHRINEGTCHLGMVSKAHKPSALEAGAGEPLPFEDRHSLRQRGISLREQSELQFLSGVFPERRMLPDDGFNTRF